MGTRRTIILRCASALLILGTLAQRSMSEEWGHAAGLRSPHPDSKGRAGHWWWPDTTHDATSTVGNRGRVYGKLPAVAAQSAAPTPRQFPVADERPPKLICGGMGPNFVLFHHDKVELRPEGIQEIQKLVAHLQNFPGDTLTCIGHTDDTGTEAYNQQLGLRRAQAVVDYMKASGVAPERVRAASKGETHPIVPNNTPANRALNRRVDYEFKLGN